MLQACWRNTVNIQTHNNVFNMSVLENLPGFIAIKNKVSKYCYSNQANCRLLGFEDFDDFYQAGANDYNLRCAAVELANTFIKEDKTVMSSEAPLKMVGRYGCKNDEWKILIGEKKPYYDNENCIQGVICCYLDTTKSNIINTFMLINKRDRKFTGSNNLSYYFKPGYDMLNLSKRQSECLYYLVRGYSNKQIGEVLSLSNRTVETHVEVIKDKLACNSRQQLIEKIIDNGLLNIIPESLFS